LLLPASDVLNAVEPLSEEAISGLLASAASWKKQYKVFPWSMVQLRTIVSIQLDPGSYREK
jgi:hypothetical protein